MPLILGAKNLRPSFFQTICHNKVADVNFFGGFDTKIKYDVLIQANYDTVDQQMLQGYDSDISIYTGDSDGKEESQFMPAKIIIKIIF